MRFPADAGAAVAGCIMAAAAAWPGPAPAVEGPRGDLAELEGHYAETRRLQMLDEKRTAYRAEDVLEIDRVDGRRARIRLTTHFTNGHSCAIEGTARLSGGALLLRERRAGADGRLCRLIIRRRGDRVRWSDGGGSCASYCGMRGTLNGSLPYSARASLR